MSIKIIGLKELREKTEDYIKAVEKRGDSFVVVRRSKPVFKIAPVAEEEKWETVVDFTKVKKGGIKLQNLLSRL